MDYKDIITLANKYWECETTDDEENILYDFFNQHKGKQLPEALEDIREFFEDSDERNGKDGEGVDGDSDEGEEENESIGASGSGDNDENEEDEEEENEEDQDESQSDDEEDYDDDWDDEDEDEGEEEENEDENEPDDDGLEDEELSFEDEDLVFLDNQGEQFDNHEDWPSGDDSDTAVQIVEDMLIQAAEEVEKNGHGTIPNELRSKVADIRNRRKPKPVADWKRYVRRYLGNEFSEFIRKSRKRESRRFPDMQGNRHRRKSHILVAVDTSGSVSIPEYIEFFGQIRTLTSVASFQVVECDAAIQNTYEFRNKPNMEFHGGGGTSFQPVIDYYIANRKKFDALIYFTDGECWVPDNTPSDTLWVISSQGDSSDKKKFQVNGAKVVFIPPSDK